MLKDEFVKWFGLTANMPRRRFPFHFRKRSAVPSFIWGLKLCAVHRASWETVLGTNQSKVTCTALHQNNFKEQLIYGHTWVQEPLNAGSWMVGVHIEKAGRGFFFPLLLGAKIFLQAFSFKTLLRFICLIISSKHTQLVPPWTVGDSIHMYLVQLCCSALCAPVHKDLAWTLSH